MTPEKHAEQAGYRSAFAGWDMMANPYFSGPLFRAWHRGWKAAEADKVMMHKFSKDLGDIIRKSGYEMNKTMENK